MDPGVLEKENRRLKQEIQACREQGLLFENLLKMVGSVSEKEALTHAMQRTLDTTVKISGAQTGSLFLLDDQGRVTDSILTRGEVGPDLKTRLVGTVLDKGLAGWVRQHLQPGLVEDTRTDSRWISLPDEPYTVRSVLSVPIIKNGAVFGILTLMHPHPCFFSADDVEGVRVTADHMALAIEGAQIYVRVEEVNRLRRKALERDLSLARQVQKSFLPARMPAVEGYGFGAVNRPAQAVGGDFYYFYPLPGNRLGIALGDVSGKGIAASLFMARLSSEMAHYAPVFMEPGRLLAKINQELCLRAKQGMFVTLTYLVLDLASDIVLCANAGHLPPMVRDPDGIRTMDEGKGKGPPLGILPDAVYGQHGFSLGPGSMVMLYTDGVVEARNGTGQIFGFERLGREMERSAGSGPDGLISGVLEAVDRFSGRGDGRDDLTLVCFQKKGQKPETGVE
jgi:sigma-B regulation protein RsbU (phosphoserine phosphatase)